MAYTYLALTNELLTRLNEVNLTSVNFTSSRGVQTQAKDSILSSISHINHSEFHWPFNHNTQSLTLSPGKIRYDAPTDNNQIDYLTFRILKDGDGNSTSYLSVIDYNEYLARFVYQEDNQVDTLVNDTSLVAGDTTIIVDSTTGFESTGDIVIEDETIPYTGTTSTTFTGCTRGDDAVAHDNNSVVAQFTGGGVPSRVFRTPDDNFGFVNFPNKTYSLVYEYYSFPTPISAHGDVPVIPERFRSVIVDGAMYYLYQYRGDTTTAALSLDRFEKGVKDMRTLLINRYNYIRSHYIPRSHPSSIIVGSRYVF